MLYSEGQIGKNIPKKQLQTLFVFLFLSLITFLIYFPSRVFGADINISSKHPTSRPQVIISLTTHQLRISTVHLVIESLLNQTVKADKIVLWLAPEQISEPEKQIPEELLALVPKGLTIDWHHNIRSYEKLIPSLKKYPDAIIITVDDDSIYQDDVVERLLNAYHSNPKMIHTLRGHGITFEGEKIAPYLKWHLKMKYAKPSYRTLMTGVGGVLYPPHVLHPDVFDEKKYRTWCQFSDDIWFWAMAVHQGTKINLIPNDGNAYITIPGTQRVALWRRNMYKGRNDECISNIVKAYPDILEKLKYKKIQGIKK